MPSFPQTVINVLGQTFTSTRRYCDQACLLVDSFAHSFDSLFVHYACIDLSKSKSWTFVKFDASALYVTVNFKKVKVKAQGHIRCTESLPLAITRPWFKISSPSLAV